MIRKTATMLGALIAMPLPSPAQATQGAGDNIGRGSEGYFAGMLPDKAGLYSVEYLNYYDAGRFVDGNGRSSIQDFRLTAKVFASRLFYMSDIKVAGGRLGMFAIGSIASLRTRSASGIARRTSFGDLTVGPALGWDFGDFHPLLAADVVFPVGDYKTTRALNTGNNYHSVRPIVAFSYLPRNGMEVSAKITYTFNGRNSATDLRSGQLFHFDYSASYLATKDLRVGINGYFLQQTTDDRQYGQIVDGDGFRSRIVAVGPAVNYHVGKASIDFKVLKEFAARNHAEGSSIWLKAAFPIGWAR
jgi:hypothetical protein